jgi:hypothetical protein
MQTIRRLKSFRNASHDGDAQRELPFEMIEKIYSYACNLSLCILSMTCKRALVARPTEKELELALQVRAKERLLARLDAYGSGLAEALTNVLSEGNTVMAGEFLLHCLVSSFSPDTLDIITTESLGDGRPMHSLLVGARLLQRIYDGIHAQSLSYSMESEDQPSEELRSVGVLRCYKTMVQDLSIRVLVMDNYDSARDRVMSVQSTLKRLYRFSPFECAYDGKSFCASKMRDKMKKIGRTRHQLLEDKLRALEDNYDLLDDLSDNYSKQRIQEENGRLIEEARTSLANLSSKYRALGYTIKEK